MTRLSAIVGQNVERDVEITGVTADSRKVKPGFLFAALPGSKVDGRTFIAKAIELGAAAVLAPEDVVDVGVPVIHAKDIRRADGFYAAIRRYWPGLPDGALAPGYAGIRPKISGPGEPAADFMVSGPAAHGIGGLINLFGIESPGLTSSLALAEHVAAILNGSNAG